MQKTAKTVKEIANYLNVGEELARRKIKEYQIEYNRFVPFEFTNDQKEFIRKKYGKITYVEMSKQLNVNKSFIIAFCNKDKIVDLEKCSKLRSIEGKKRKVKKCNDYYFSIPNLENSYWAGFFAADGNVGSYNRVALQLSVKDIEHLRKFYNSLEADNKFTVYKRKNGIEMCSFSVNSEQIVNDLKNNFNITPRKTFTLEFPEQLSDENKLAFIVGYIDGDGCISKRVGYNLCAISIIGNYKFLSSLKNTLYGLCSEEQKNTSEVRKKDGIFSIVFSKKATVKLLKNKADEMNIPKLSRKWDKIVFYD